MLEHSWALYIDPLMVLIMERLRAYFLETRWGLIVVKLLALMKA